jgi:hypothetical protein
MDHCQRPYRAIAEARRGARQRPLPRFPDGLGPTIVANTALAAAANRRSVTVEGFAPCKYSLAAVWGRRFALNERVMLRAEPEADDGFGVMRSVAADKEDEEALSCEVSDEALEAAGGASEMPGRTLYSCLPPMPLTMAYGCQ